MKYMQLNDEATVPEELSGKQMKEVEMTNEHLEQMNESEEITGGYIALPAQDFIRGNSDTDNAGENYESPPVRDENQFESSSNDSDYTIPVVDDITLLEQESLQILNLYV